MKKQLFQEAYTDKGIHPFEHRFSTKLTSCPYKNYLRPRPRRNWDQIPSGKRRIYRLGPQSRINLGFESLGCQGLKNNICCEIGSEPSRTQE